jgi:hypothetical protein
MLHGDGDMHIFTLHRSEFWMVGTMRAIAWCTTQELTCACVWVGVLGCTRIHAGRAIVWFGLQAFGYTSAFNANIGAWNTASVSNMVNVSAGRDLGRRAQRGGALCRLLFDAARPLCAVAPPMRV